MGWRIGDLGRFKTEDPARPRFEVVGASKEGITVWYGGSTSTQVIPLRTFKYDCVRFWNMKPVAEHTLPVWLKPGVEFMLLQRNGQIQAVTKDSLGRKTYQTVNVGTHPLTLRHIRADFTSNLIQATNTLVLIPLDVIIRYGCHQRSRFERLRSSRDPLRDDDLDEIL